ncbi:MAG: tetratricopeptide repeat protein [Anaerolineae bacterium]
MKRLMLIVIVGLMAVLTLAGTARAQGETPTGGRDPAAEQEIINRLAAISKDAVPLFQQGTTALDAGDGQTAKAYFQFVLQLAPKFPEALRRLSYAELQLGNVEPAIARAREAMTVDNSPYNRVTLTRALLAANDPTSNAEALTLAKSAVQDAPNDLSTNEALMWAGAANKDTESIRQGSNALVRLAPDYGWGHYYIGMLALQDGQRQKAQAELQLAKNQGVPQEMINEALTPGAAQTAAAPAPTGAAAIPAQPTAAAQTATATNAGSGMGPLFLGAIAIAFILIVGVLVLYARR